MLHGRKCAGFVVGRAALVVVASCRKSGSVGDVAAEAASAQAASCRASDECKTSGLCSAGS